MAFYIQYDPDGSLTDEPGFITGTVYTTGTPPPCDNQIVFDNFIDTTNKAVDPDTKQLIDISNGDIFNQITGQFEPDINQQETGFWQRIKSALGL